MNYNKLVKALIDAKVSGEDLLRILTIVEEGEETSDPPDGLGSRRFARQPRRPPNPPPPDNGAEGHEEEDLTLHPTLGRPRRLTDAERREKRTEYNRKYYEKNRAKREADKKLIRSFHALQDSDKISNKITDPFLSERFVQVPTYRYVADPIEEYAPSKAPFSFFPSWTFDKNYTIKGRAKLAEKPWTATLPGFFAQGTVFPCFFNSLPFDNAKKTVPSQDRVSTTPREDNVEIVATQPQLELIPYEASGDITEVAAAAYNDVAATCGWGRVVKLSPARKAGLKARLHDAGGLSGWQEMMARAGRSAFLRGEGVRTEAHQKWRPSLDFFLTERAFLRLMEGEFDDRTSVGQKFTRDDALDAMLAASRVSIARRRAGQETEISQ